MVEKFQALEGLTPARAGFVLLGRPAPGQLVGTAVELALRGHLMVGRHQGSWVALPGPLGTPAQPAVATGLSAYEDGLLGWMLPDERGFLLDELDEDRTAELEPVIGLLCKELRRKRLLARRRPWRSGPDAERLTARGRELAERLRMLRARLRVLPLPPDRMRAVFGHLVAFGLCTESRMRGAPADLVQLAEFAAAWHAACADLPGWRQPPPVKREFEPLDLDSPPLFAPGVPHGVGEL